MLGKVWFTQKKFCKQHHETVLFNENQGKA